MYRKIFKRLLDLILSVIGLVITCPILVLFILILMIANKGKPFFFQKRPGKNEKVFSIIKFKTMSDATDDNGVLLPDSKRLTEFGSFIRKTSIDELLQLINVIKGDMSLIGPRPLLIEYLSEYNNDQRQRHNVKPGISGWAQVNGRNSISWEKKFEYDVYYVNNYSFLFDMKIFFLTIKNVLSSRGISHDGEVSMKRFRRMK